MLNTRQHNHQHTFLNHKFSLGITILGVFLLIVSKEFQRFQVNLQKIGSLDVSPHFLATAFRK